MIHSSVSPKTTFSYVVKYSLLQTLHIHCNLTVDMSCRILPSAMFSVGVSLTPLLRAGANVSTHALSHASLGRS